MRKFRFIKRIAPVQSPINFLTPLDTCPPIRCFQWPGEPEIVADHPGLGHRDAQPTASPKDSALN